MKIKKITLKNFANFNEFELTFNKQVTRLVGINGSGKTTIGLTAIWAAFKGVAEKSKSGQLIGERFRFIGDNGKSADIKLLLVDEQRNKEIELKRHITKDVNQISFKSTAGDSIDKDYIEGLFNTMFLSAKHFESMSGKEQALSLGIDTSDIDNVMSGKKEEAAFIRRELKSMGVPEEVEEVRRVSSINELLQTRDKICEQNQANDDTRGQIDYKNNLIKKHMGQIEELKKHCDILNNELESMEEPGVDVDTTEIDNNIANAEQINLQATNYAKYVADKANVDNKKAELEENLSEQKEITAERLDYIKSFNFNIISLDVSEKGELLYKDKPIKSPYFSKGELEMVVAQLASSLNPELKVRFIDDFDTLDADNQEKLIKNLLKMGFQLITAEVGSEIKEDGAVLLSECKVVERS